MMVADTRIVNPTTGEVIASSGDILTDEDLYRLEVIALEMNGCQPRPYVFRTYRCNACGQTQPDAGQSACLWCGQFWRLERVWPV
jgi:hypothetical protein